ncbi:hypothetical protein N0V83_004237 [Neocucurbitaria cava]|uniref:Uncharacterized protein n=1 Tax=Neocucurbitaria cava TaxID=798079 RepID=A0A9W8YAQ9_9PLEO|nr:hypothetical protein N0V83_004237 [Neocucurbitaria cava]
MSDTEKPGAVAKKEASRFTERELQLLGWAMQSLKSGPPEIDYDKLAAFAGMSNPRSAGNAWAKLKNKLMSGDDTASAPATPKKGGAKKKTAVKDSDGDEVMTTPKATPKKTPRKRAAKKQDVDGEASPKKKVAGKKALSDETVKSEPEEAEDIEKNESPVKAELEDFDIEVEV